MNFSSPPPRKTTQSHAHQPTNQACVTFKKIYSFLCYLLHPHPRAQKGLFVRSNNSSHRSSDLYRPRIYLLFSASPGISKKKKQSVNYGPAARMPACKPTTRTPQPNAADCNRVMTRWTIILFIGDNGEGSGRISLSAARGISREIPR